MTETDDNDPWDTIDTVLCALRNFFTAVGVTCTLMFIAGWVTR